MAFDRRSHWDEAYEAKGETGVGWFEDAPTLSLDLLRAHGAGPASSLIDIGGGASRLVDALLAAGMHDLTVLDLSLKAIETARQRLGSQAADVGWVTADVTVWMPERRYDFWHDRAAFHFLIEADDRAAYLTRLREAVAPGGHAIIATFAPDGPERCSNLAVMRYDPETLAETVGSPFRLVDSRRHAHPTPFGTTQMFQWSVFRRVV